MRKDLVFLTCLFGLAGFCGCSAVRSETFYIGAINTKKEAVTCIIYVDDEIVAQGDNPENPVRTPANVPIKFRIKPDGMGFGSVKVAVKAVEVENGKIVKGLLENERSPYLQDGNAARSVRIGDARKQIFILRPNRER